MWVVITEWEKRITWGTGIEVTANKVVNLLLRAENNLIKVDENNDVYVDLQLEDWILPADTIPVGVTTGRVLQADWWITTGTMLAFKTTSWDVVTWIYWDNGNLYVDNWTGTFKQVYNKPQVDALFTQLRSELSTVSFTGDFDDLVNKPVLWTAASKDVGTNAGNVPILDANWKLDSSIVPSTWVMTSYTVTNKSDLTTLSSATKWDIGIVTSENKTYILSNNPYSDINNWTELLFPTGSVSSVNWFTWAVNLTTGYIAESNNKLYVSPTEKATWNNKLWANNVSTVTLTGNYNDLNNKPIVDSTLNTTSTNAIQNSTVATAVNTINTNITNLQSDMANAQTDISNIQSTISWATWDITNLQGQINTINWEITTINWDITTIQWDISDLQTAVAGWISDAPFSSAWDWDTTHAPSKNAVYDVLGDVETLLANI